MFPPDVVKSVQLFHLPTTGGANQKYAGTADATVQAAVLPMDRSSVALEGMSGIESWEIYFQPDADVRLQDKVVIAGFTTNFYVRNTFQATFGGLAHIRATVSRQL